jgi:soluble lytic murein transglycosylase-like protein
LTKSLPRLALVLAGIALLGTGCTTGSLKFSNPALESRKNEVAFVPATTVDGMISEYAATYGVPEALVRRVVQKESKFNPNARNGPYWGLMQIRHDTAKSMGYQGTASGLLDPRQNLTYGVKYLRGAYLVAGKDADRAMRFYASGYYYDAKRKGLLKEIYGK